MDGFDKFFTKYSYKFPKGYPDLNDPKDTLLLESLISDVLGKKFKLKEVGALGKNAMMKYPYRAELFAKKFTTKDSFTNAKTEEDVVLDKIVIKGKEFTPKDNPKDIENAILDAEGIAKLYGGNINGLSFASIAKTKEFGGGGGIRGGAVNTAIQESAQSLVNALAYKKGKLTVEDLTEENLKSVINEIDVDVSDDKMLDFIANQPSWEESFVGTANTLVSKFPNKGYTQHRQSNFVKELYKHAAEMLKKDILSPGTKVGMDKWNPADIWMTSLASVDILTQTKSLDDLNALILQLYVDKILIGVSLKKTDLNPPTKEYQIGKEAALDTYEGHSDATLSTKSTYIFTTGPRIELRTFGSPGFAAEIQGTKAGGGKAGLGPINTILKGNNIDPIDPANVNKEDFIELYNKYAKEKINGVGELDQMLDDKSKETVKSGAMKGKPKGPIGAKDWLISRNFGLQIVDIFNDIEDKDKLVQDILRYAYSSNEWSSAYIKIGN